MYKNLCIIELLQMRVRLGVCKNCLSPVVILYYRSFEGDTSVAVVFVLCLDSSFCAV